MNKLPVVLQKYIMEKFLTEDNDLLNMRLVDKKSNAVSTIVLNKKIEPAENQISEHYFIKFVQHKVKKCFFMSFPSLPFCLEGKRNTEDKSLIAYGITNAIKTSNTSLIEFKEGENFKTTLTYSPDNKGYYTNSFANFTYKIEPSAEKNDKTFNNLKSMLSMSSIPPAKSNFNISKNELKFKSIITLSKI